MTTGIYEYGSGFVSIESTGATGATSSYNIGVVPNGSYLYYQSGVISGVTGPTGVVLQKSYGYANGYNTIDNTGGTGIPAGGGSLTLNASGPTSNFILNSGIANGSLQYKGTNPINVQITISINFRAIIQSASVITCIYQPYINNGGVDNSIRVTVQPNATTAGNDQFFESSNTFITTLNHNDYININVGSSQDSVIFVLYTQLSIIEV